MEVMTWVVSIHCDGGSTSETVDVMYAFSVLDENMAMEVVEKFNNASSKLGQEYFAQCFDVTPAKRIKFPLGNPALATQVTGRPLRPGEQVADLEKWVEELVESNETGTEWPTLRPAEPEPLSKAEEAEAIRLLTGRTD